MEFIFGLVLFVVNDIVYFYLSSTHLVAHVERRNFAQNAPKWVHGKPIGNDGMKLNHWKITLVPFINNGIEKKIRSVK